MPAEERKSQSDHRSTQYDTTKHFLDKKNKSFIVFKCRKPEVYKCASKRRRLFLYRKSALPSVVAEKDAAGNRNFLVENNFHSEAVHLKLRPKHHCVYKLARKDAFCRKNKYFKETRQLKSDLVGYGCHILTFPLNVQFYALAFLLAIKLAS